MNTSHFTTRTRVGAIARAVAPMSLALVLLGGGSAAAVGQALDWSTYLGGSGEDWPAWFKGVIVDDQGRACVVGRTYSPNFPTTEDAFDRQLDGDRDGFVSRLSANGATLEWSTFLGGSDIEAPMAATFDDQGRIIVVGGATSTDFPVTDEAYDTTHNGAADVFVAILDPSAEGDDQLVYSTFLGGSGVDAALDVFYDASGAGAIFVVGSTASADFPFTDGAYDLSYNGGERDMFIARFDPTLSTLEACTFLGGSEADHALFVHVAGSGIVTISGRTDSPDMPTSEGAYDDTFDGGPDERDGFVAQLDQDLTELVYGTYLGGSAGESLSAMDVEASGAIVVAGWTYSEDFPVTSGAYDPSYNGGGDIFVTRLDPAAMGEGQLVASTFIGGSSEEGANSLTVDIVSGAVTIVGAVDGEGLPTTPDAMQPDFNGGLLDGFLTRLDWGLEQMLYGTYLGGPEIDVGFALAGNVASRLTVAGRNSGGDFPVTPGAYDESWNGDFDAFILRIDLCPADFDEDGDVDTADLLFLLGAWGTPDGDVDGDGTTNTADLLALLGAWGPCE
jgi:hypothetical protein